MIGLLTFNSSITLKEKLRDVDTDYWVVTLKQKIRYKDVTICAVMHLNI